MAKSTTRKKPAGRKTAVRKKSAATKKDRKSQPEKKDRTKKTSRKWSKKVNETSDALDLEEGVFKGNDPEKIARSLKRSATRSKRKKGTPYQSAMSMLNFYINRGGHNLSASQKEVLEKSKDELRKLFGREED